MAFFTSISDLKSEIRVLESLFGESHQLFQFTRQGFDEFTCTFMKGDRKIVVNGNLITDFYPETPPLWFSDNDILDAVIMQLGDLTENRLVYQVSRPSTNLT